MAKAAESSGYARSLYIHLTTAKNWFTLSCQGKNLFLNEFSVLEEGVQKGKS